ncbi:sulfate adenylyltransferase subunit 1 [Streptomyces aurantiacus]|uniref:sulfate adenylyltransferase subunit 1 n=1 Tax=Streptomyces aurantiacus TaxID=47760 RepID=UPI0027933198|nr:GTP-binding protein [Streptomyces aurantiacus]MDQ0773825.1 sulfate adenylyltransferase subunit 1 [Streptomyces aurantiacus]
MTSTTTPAGRTTVDTLRFATAGSVDDGKSTLVGRLLHDSKSVLTDQLEAVAHASRNRGQDTPDLALLTDGLRAEREQGITIDVAYRYFATAKRRFILADTPGHVQYTRNMVTGASTAELTVVLVDARNGVVEQTRRHAAIAALLRVPHVVLAVNKMDLVGYEAKEFDRIVEDFAAHAAELDLPGFTPIPVSALVGDNVVDRSAPMDWYEGPTLLEHLESVPVGGDPSGQPARFPVQYVIRHGEKRHYAGQLAAGSLRVGDRVTIHPSGGSSEIEAIDVLGEEVREAYAPQSLALRLADPLDVSRGDMITSGADAPALTRDVRAAVCHLADRPLRVGDRVLVRHTTRTVKAIVKDLTDGRGRHPDRATSGAPGGQRVGVVELSANDLGRITLRTAEPLALDDYARCRRTGAFILVDPADGATLTAGMVDLTEAGSPTWAPMA